MSSFKGSVEYSVDSKGRINIPAKMRKDISPEANSTFIVTRGFEKCIFIYPLDEWTPVEHALRSLNMANSQHRFIKRMVLEPATEAQLDGQSRIVIPKELLDFASIENQVLILGILNHLELWNPEIYRQYKSSQPQTYEEAAQGLFQQ